MNSLKQNDDVEERGLNKTVNNVNNSQEAKVIIRRYKDIIKTQNKKAVEDISTQGELLKKFNDTQNFFDNVGQSELTKHFKIPFV